MTKRKPHSNETSPRMIENEHAGESTGVNPPRVICSTQVGTTFFLDISPEDVGHAIVIFGPTGLQKATLNGARKDVK